jgi:hypothetical protein
MAGSTESDSKTSVRTRSDGRRSLLVYLDADLIKVLKKTALDKDRNTYEIVEDGVRDWLAGHADHAACFAFGLSSRSRLSDASVWTTTRPSPSVERLAIR